MFVLGLSNKVTLSQLPINHSVLKYFHDSMQCCVKMFLFIAIAMETDNSVPQNAQQTQVCQTVIAFPYRLVF